MGVLQLWNILEPVKQTGDLSLLHGRTICVDLSVWICEAHGAKGLKANVLKPHLRNVFFRVWNLIRAGVNLLFVADGDPPKVKWEAILKRTQARGFGRGRAGKGGSSTSGPTRKVGRSNFRVWVNECIAMLKLLGVPYVESSGEAEALCAWLNAKGIVDGCITNDGDVFLYGGRVVYKDLAISTKDCSMDCYCMDDIETQLGLTRDSLVSLAILLGCDYLPQGVPGVGKEMGMKLVHELDGINLLKRFIQWSTFQIQDCDISKIERTVKQKALRIPGFPNREVIDEFLSPKLKTNNLSIPKGYKCPDLKGMQEFCFRYLEWPEEYTTEKILPLVAYWQMNKPSPSCGLDVISPERIVKSRVQNKIECYEVMWRNNDIGDACEQTFNTIENKEMFDGVYPNIVKEFEALQLEKKTKKPGKRKGKKTADDDKDNITNLCEELDTLSLQTAKTNSSRPRSTRLDMDQKPTHQSSKQNNVTGSTKNAANGNVIRAPDAGSNLSVVDLVDDDDDDNDDGGGDIDDNDNEIGVQSSSNIAANDNVINSKAIGASHSVLDLYDNDDDDHGGDSGVDIAKMPLLHSVKSQKAATSDVGNSEAVAPVSINHALDDDHNISTQSLDMPLPLSQRLAKLSAHCSSGHTESKVSTKNPNKENEMAAFNEMSNNCNASCGGDNASKKAKQSTSRSSQHGENKVKAKKPNRENEKAVFNEVVSKCNPTYDAANDDHKSGTACLVAGNVFHDSYSIGDSLDNFTFDSINIVDNNHNHHGNKEDSTNVDNGHISGNHGNMNYHSVKACSKSATTQKDNAEYADKHVYCEDSKMLENDSTYLRTLSKKEKQNPNFKVFHCVEFSSDSEDDDSWLLVDDRKGKTKKADKSFEFKAGMHRKMIDAVHLDTGATQTPSDCQISSQKWCDNNSESQTKQTAVKLGSNSEKHRNDITSATVNNAKSKAVPQNIHKPSKNVKAPALEDITKAPKSFKPVSNLVKLVPFPVKQVSNQGKTTSSIDKPISMSTKQVSKPDKSTSKPVYDAVKQIPKPVKPESHFNNISSDEECEILLLTPGKPFLLGKEQSKHNKTRNDTVHPEETSLSHLEEEKNHIKSNQESRVESPLFVPMSLSERLGKHLHGQQKALSTLRTLSSNLE